MTVSKAGCGHRVRQRAGRPGTPIQLADGQKLEKANITLPRGSVVTGVVIDENGEPSPGTSVRVMRFLMRTGERTLQQNGQDQTDDRGMYRIYGLQPGEYIVSASPRNNNIGDLRQTILAEIEAAVQQAQAARGGGPGAGPGGGAGGVGGRGAARGAAPIDVTQIMSGRGQQMVDRASQLQQQLQQVEQEQAVAYAPVYYPGTTSPSGAATVTIGVGEERAGIDFQLQLVQTAKIEGRIQGPDGTPVQETRLALVSADRAGVPSIPGVNSNMARVDREGKFSFTNVTPGQYRVMARAAVRPAADPSGSAAQAPGGRGRDMGPGGRGGVAQQVLWASADVTIGGQSVNDLVLTLQPGMTMTGRIVFEGSSIPAPTDLTRVRVTIVPRGQQQGFEMGGVPPAQVDTTGRFTIMGVVPGRYTLTANVPPGAGRAGGPDPAPPGPAAHRPTGTGGRRRRPVSDS
jgi:protocatechuate 3,4-dioxygenase beta subunit